MSLSHYAKLLVKCSSLELQLWTSSRASECDVGHMLVTCLSHADGMCIIQVEGLPAVLYSYCKLATLPATAFSAAAGM